MDFEQKLWFMYVNILGWQYHPRNPPENRMTPEEAYKHAMEATCHFHFRYKIEAQEIV